MKDPFICLYCVFVKVWDDKFGYCIIKGQKVTLKKDYCDEWELNEIIGDLEKI